MSDKTIAKRIKTSCQLHKVLTDSLRVSVLKLQIGIIYTHTIVESKVKLTFNTYLTTIANVVGSDRKCLSNSVSAAVLISSK